MTTDAWRTTFIQSLHDLADVLHADPTIPLPYEGNSSPLSWFVHDAVEQALTLRDLLSDAVTAHDTSTTFPVVINGSLGGLRVRVYVDAKVALVDPAESPPRWPACDPRLGLDAVLPVSA